MKLRKWVQVVILILTIGSLAYGMYAFARMENSIEIDTFHFVMLILDIPLWFILTCLLESDYCTILKDIEHKLSK